MLFAQSSNAAEQRATEEATLAAKKALALAESAKVLAQETLTQQQDVDNRWRLLYPIVLGGASLLLFVGVVVAVRWLLGPMSDTVWGAVERIVLVALGVLTPLVVRWGSSK